MKKSFSKLALLCLFALITGCKNTNPDSVSEFKYDITMTELTEPSWYDLVDSVSYITLKSPDGTAMGEIKQLIVNDDRIYVLADGFYCFDMQGNCLFKQTSKGRARNEFMDATSMSVSDGQLFIFDRIQNKGLFFEARTGRYISTVTPASYTRSAYCAGDYIICRNTIPEENDNARYSVYSRKKPDQFIAGLFQEKEHNSSIRGTDTWSNDDGLFYTSYLRNLAWKIKGKEITPFIKVNVPEDKTIPDHVIDDMIEKGRISPENDNTDYIYGLSYITECDGFICGRLSDKHNFINFIYDKKTSNSTFFYNTQEIATWQLLPIYERPSTGYADCIYTICTTDNIMFIKSLIGNVGEEPTREKFRKAYDVCNSVTENDYAIVARIWFKEL